MFGSNDNFLKLVSTTNESDGNKVWRNPNRFPKLKKPERRAPRLGEGLITNRSAHLILPDIVSSGGRAHEFREIKTVDPWTRYRKAFQLYQGGFVTVVSQIKGSMPNNNIFVIRTISGPDAAEKFRMLNRISHKKFVDTYEVFKPEESLSFYILSNYMDTCLFQITCSPAYPTEPQLAAILGQASL